MRSDLADLVVLGALILCGLGATYLVRLSDLALFMRWQRRGWRRLRQARPPVEDAEDGCPICKAAPGALCHPDCDYIYGLVKQEAVYQQHRRELAALTASGDPRR